MRSNRAPRNSAVMRWIFHLVAIASALVTFVALVPVIRTGEISLFVGLAWIVTAWLAACVVLVVAVGALRGDPPARWPSLLREFFRGHGEK